MKSSTNSSRSSQQNLAPRRGRSQARRGGRRASASTVIESVEPTTNTPHNDRPAISKFASEPVPGSKSNPTIISDDEDEPSPSKSAASRRTERLLSSKWAKITESAPKMQCATDRDDYAVSPDSRTIGAYEYENDDEGDADSTYPDLHEDTDCSATKEEEDHSEGGTSEPMSDDRADVGNQEGPYVRRASPVTPREEEEDPTMGERPSSDRSTSINNPGKIDDTIRELFETCLGKPTLQKPKIGKIYIFKVTVNGVEHLYKIGKSKIPITKRMKIVDKCKLELIKVWESPTKFFGYGRAEKLIHKELANFLTQPPCADGKLLRHRHTEYFHLSLKDIKPIVWRWERLLRQQPYDESGRLHRYWRDRLDKLVGPPDDEEHTHHYARGRRWSRVFERWPWDRPIYTLRMWWNETNFDSFKTWYYLIWSSWGLLVLFPSLSRIALCSQFVVFVLMSMAKSTCLLCNGVP